MTDWKKSSYCGYNGDCVEVAMPQWQKSSHSGACNCVEVAEDPEVVQVRDSKDPDGPVLVLTRDAWARFLAVSKVPDRAAVPLGQLGAPVPPSDFQSSI